MFSHKQDIYTIHSKTWGTSHKMGAEGIYGADDWKKTCKMLSSAHDTDIKS